MQSTTEQIITEGFPDGQPWIIDNIDKELVNLAVARLLSLATSQTDLINEQVKTLLAQVKSLEAMKKTIADLPTDYLVPPTVDSSGKALITDPQAVYDLVGASISRLQSSPSDVDRLLKFTQGLVNSSTYVNIADSPVYAVSYTLPDGTIGNANFEMEYLPHEYTRPQFELALNRLYSVPSKPGTYYLCAYIDNQLESLKVNSVTLVTKPPAYTGYDAYRLEEKKPDGTWVTQIVPVKAVISLPEKIDERFQFPDGSDRFTSATGVPFDPNERYLYRLPDGTLKLVNSKGAPIEFRENPEGFVIPASDSQISNWLGQASYDRLQKLLQKIESDQVVFSLTDRKVVEWNSLDGTVRGFGQLPPVTVSSINDLQNANTIKVGELALVATPGANRYFFKVSNFGDFNTYSSFLEVKLDPEKAFQLFSTPRDMIALKGSYSEVMLKLTQRSAELNLFLNQAVNKQNYQYDTLNGTMKALLDTKKAVARLF